MMKRARLPLLVLLASAASGCVHAGDVVLLDRKTVLEEQASGELHPLENDLREAAIVPRGGEFTRAELEEAGADLSEGTLSRVIEVGALVRTEAELIDDLLVRRCVGEGHSGLLVETPRSCLGRTDESRSSAAVQRVNRARRQLWRYLHEKRPEVPEPELRATWRRLHLESVVCGGQVQDEDGKWQIKRC
jgi:hypothetical protein